MNNLDRLARIFNGDTDKIRRHLEINARLALMRYQPAPARPRPFRQFTRDAIAGHADALIAAGVLTADGRRVAHHTDHGTIFQDPRDGRWYYEDHRGVRHHLRDDD